MTRMVTTYGTRATRRGPKNPLRVAAGRASVKGRDPQGQVRSSHLGYDCYVTGHLNGVGRTRIIMRRNRLPPHLPADVIAMMPVEMWWPQRDHKSCHALIEAIITADLPALATWKSSWPEHTFGFEEFLERCERRITGIRNDHTAASANTLPKRLDGTAEKSTITALFPGIPDSVERHGGRDEDRYCIRTWIVRFDDGLAALRVDVKGVVEGPDSIERVPCSRAYVDLIDGTFEIIEHYPGRLRALGLPVDLIYRVLGVRSPESSHRRQHQRRPMHPQDRESAPTAREHALAVVRQGAAAQTIISTGDTNAEVIKQRGPQGEARYQKQLDENDAYERLEEPFPAAPGVA